MRPVETAFRIMLYLHHHPFLASLIGGILIGGASAFLLLLNGRIAGISGIVASLLQRPARIPPEQLAFVAGLLCGPALFAVLSGQWPRIHIETPWPLLILAGLLVGYGTRKGSGCTSGHGVMGLARLSSRSFAAVAVFLAAAVLTVFVMHVGGVV